MADDQNGGDYKLTLAQQILGKATSAIAGLNSPVSESNDATEVKVTSVVAQRAPVSDTSPSAAASLEPIQSEVPQKQLKTPGELAEMIELDLGRHPDSPKAGFQVTVYGWPRWRAMLTIKPAAGPVRNPHEWRDLTNELAERLRKRYDLAWE